MNLLFTGRGSSGSWKVRGEQLGHALGATVKPAATRDDIDDADLVVVVKRPSPGMVDNLKASSTPWVWDLVDFYPQPACTAWSKDYAIKWVRRQLEAFNPDAVIWPNDKMHQDCGGYTNSYVLYHHARPDRHINPVRRTVGVVGYEGSRRYLGRWEKAVKLACKQRGWRLAINEGTHYDWDIVLAFRDKAFNGYVQRCWKSNVKLANCHGSGTPFLGAKENGYLETGTGHEVYCESIKDVPVALDKLSDYDFRLQASLAFQAKSYPLSVAANDLNNWLNSL